ncbi:transposase [Mesorhizobium australicum]
MSAAPGKPIPAACGDWAASDGGLPLLS